MVRVKEHCVNYGLVDLEWYRLALPKLIYCNSNNLIYTLWDYGGENQFHIKNYEVSCNSV